MYEAWLQRPAGAFDVRRFALNVDPQEGDLRLVTPEQLDSSIAATQAEVYLADELALADQDADGFPWSQLLLFGLTAVLVGEQFLAFSASYHAKPGARK